MKIGDKVRHQSSNFDFIGTLLICFVSSRGVRHWVVEQEITGYTQLFGEYSLSLIETKLEVNALSIDPMVEWFNSLPADIASTIPAQFAIPKPTPLPPPAYPVKMFVPIKVVPGQAAGRGKFNQDVLSYLPKRPLSFLITESIKCEIIFHFPKSEIGDIDNLTKTVLDALKGSVIYDDKQVKELHAKYLPNTKTGFDVVITKYAL